MPARTPAKYPQATQARLRPFCVSSSRRCVLRRHDAAKLFCLSRASFEKCGASGLVWRTPATILSFRRWRID
jgi:hypothetical protein